MTVKGRAIGGSSYREQIIPETFDPGTTKPESGFWGMKPQKTAQMLDRISQDNIAYLVVRYPRGTGIDYRTNVVVNPESFSESVEPQYSRRPVLGLSHEVLQYIRTASRELSMQFWISWDVYIQRGLADHDIHPVAFRDMLESLCVPAGARMAPPLVEVHWPGANLGFMGVVDSLSIEYTRFSSQGDPIEYSADVSFVEVARALMTSPSVLFYGLGINAQKGRTR